MAVDGSETGTDSDNLNHSIFSFSSKQMKIIHYNEIITSQSITWRQNSVVSSFICQTVVQSFCLERLSLQRRIVSLHWFAVILEEKSRCAFPVKILEKFSGELLEKFSDKYKDIYQDELLEEFLITSLREFLEKILKTLEKSLRKSLQNLLKLSA